MCLGERVVLYSNTIQTAMLFTQPIVWVHFVMFVCLRLGRCCLSLLVPLSTLCLHYGVGRVFGGMRSSASSVRMLRSRTAPTATQTLLQTLLPR